MDEFRFLHTADWQLGMRRWFLDADAQARYTDARFEAITTLGGLARDAGAAGIVVAGDVFESNHVERRTVLRTLEALADVRVPVWLLPGNHDALSPDTVYRRGDFRAACPANVAVLDGDEPLVPRPGVQLWGAPWRSKRPDDDPLAAVCRRLPPPDGTIRIVVGHGAVDTLSPSACATPIDVIESAIAQGRLHYVALGDRHSTTSVGDSGRIWYAGTPEQTDFDEERPGRALLVDAGPSACAVTQARVGTWRFVRARLDLPPHDPVAHVRAWLDRLPDKRRNVVRLGLTGTLTVRERALLDDAMEVAAERFAALHLWDSGSDLAVVAGVADAEELGLGGFAQTAFARLSAAAQAEGPDADAARDALALLYRLAASGGDIGVHGAAA